jgi:hypothetical protein
MLLGSIMNFDGEVLVDDTENGGELQYAPDSIPEELTWNSLPRILTNPHE